MPLPFEIRFKKSKLCVPKQAKSLVAMRKILQYMCNLLC